MLSAAPFLISLRVLVIFQGPVFLHTLFFSYCDDDLAQHGGQDHDGQADPEEDEEAGEVGILARGIEVGDARFVFDGRKDAAAALLAELFADGGGGFD